MYYCFCFKSRVIFTSRVLVFVCLPLFLCSCRGPLVPFWEFSHPPQFDSTDPQWKKHPPKVDEILAPKPYADVLVVIDQSFEECKYQRIKYLTRSEYQLNREDLGNLIDKQRVILRSEYSLNRTFNRQINDISELFGEVRGVLNSDFGALWQDQSEQIYQKIIREVLSQKQRAEYDYRLKEAEKKEAYHGRTDDVAKRDVLWSWLFLTSEQKQQITKMYLNRLKDIQKPRTIASTLQLYDHRDTDRLLMEKERTIDEIDSVIKAYDNINNELLQQDKKARDAIREVRWLEAQLAAEDDPAEKMKLRKLIVDNEFEAEKLVAVKERNSNIFHSYNWKIEGLRSAKENIKKRRDLLMSLHDVHFKIENDIASFDRIMSSKCQALYKKLREDLAKASKIIRKSRL